MASERHRRFGPAQGGPALHHRRRHLHRRHRPAGPGVRLFRPLAPCARQDHAASTRAAAAGGARRARGADRRRRQGGRLGRPDLRLDGQVAGRLGHEGRAASDAGPGQGALRRRPRRLRGRRDLPSGASDAAELVEVDYEELPACVATAHARDQGAAAGPRRHPAQHGLRVGARRPGGGRPGDRQRRARHQRSSWSTTAWCRTRSSRAPRSASTTAAPTASRSTPPARTRTSRAW